jgi:serine/threonine protein kinase
MGVTLFALVVGDVPWRFSDSKALQVLIRDAPLAFPKGAEVSAKLQSLIGRMLEKTPERRATIIETKQHPWLTNDATEPLPSQTDDCRVPITVTNEEVTKLGTLVLVKNMLRQHSLQVSPRRARESGISLEKLSPSMTSTYRLDRAAMRMILPIELRGSRISEC